MKILVVSSIPTHPTTAGNRSRLLSLCDALEELGHEIHFAWIPHEATEVAGMPARFEGRFTRLRVGTFAPKSWTLSNILRKIGRRLGLERSHVWALDAWWDPGLVAQLRELQSRNTFECVLVPYVFYSAAFEAFGPEVLKVLETQDRFAGRHAAMIASGLTPQWYSTTWDEEARGLRRADVVIAIQEEEALTFREMLGGDGNVVAVHPFAEVAKPVNPARAPRAIVVASGNDANVEGVAYFLGEVMPRILAARPDFELVLAGSVCDAFEARDHLVRLGRVDDLRDAYAEGAVALNPVRAGTGFCIKSLEALAYGLPLVATRSGSRGLPEDAKSGYTTVPDADPQAMADAIVGLLEDRSALEESASQARSFVGAWSSEQLRRLESIFVTPIRSRKIDGKVDSGIEGI